VLAATQTAGAQTSPALKQAMQSELFYMTLLRERCDAISPGFNAKTQASFEGWRTKNEAAAATLDNDPEFAAQVAALRHSSAAMPKAELAKSLEQCAELAQELTLSSPTPDTRLTSPSETWNLFVTSLRNVDRKSALACLGGSARRNYKELILTGPDEDLRQMAAHVRSFELAAAYGQFQEAIVVMDDGTGGSIVFAHDKESGEWRIQEM
jgi:hypothetical protein